MNLPSFDPVTAVLLIPISSAALLAVLPGYRLTARLNVVASLRDIPFGAFAVRDRTSRRPGRMC